MHRCQVHRAGADAEAGHLHKGDHSTAQQCNAEDAEQQQPRHNGLCRAFLTPLRQKLCQLAQHGAEHAHRKQNTADPRPALHDGKNRLLVRAVVGRVLPRVGGAVEAAVQVAGPGGKVVLGADGPQRLIGRTVPQAQHMPKAVPGLGQRRRDVGRRDRLAGGNPLAGAAGQGARVTGGVDLICHGLPVGVGGLSVGVDALKLRGAADGPIKAARAVVVEIWVAEIILQLGILLQPVGQRLQLRHGRIDFCARVGGHRQIRLVAVCIDPHHRAHGGSKGAFGKIRQGKQEKLFHEVIFQIGNCEDMAVGTSEGNLAVKVLDEYVKDFQKRNPTLRVFSCYLHQDEATPHLHIDFVPYVTNWKGKGMDTRVSLKQALKSLGFQGGNKHDTELNQWINHEKEVLAEIAKQHGIEWEQKGTHEEHLDVYNFKKKERKKEVQELEQKKENLTVENEGLTSQIAEARVDIKLLEEEKIQFQKDKEIAEKRAEKAETELKKLEDRREFLQPVMDNVSKEIKEYGMIKTFLPEATALERAVTYRDKKIKPLFIEMKNKIGAMAAQVKELTRERDSWKSKFQKKKQEHEKTKKELAEVQKDYQKLSGEKEILQGIADRYNRLLRMLGKDMVERLVQDDIRIQEELEARKQKEQMPKKIGDRIQWARERSEEYNAQIKKNKAKYRGMEL